jgi:hypothetical protein
MEFIGFYWDSMGIQPSTIGISWGYQKYTVSHYPTNHIDTF